jgi:HK97 family phage major capsid protein
MKLEVLKQKFIENSEAITKIVDSSEDMTEDQQKQIASLDADNAKIGKQIEALETAEKQTAMAQKMSKRPAPKLDPLVTTSLVGEPPKQNADEFKVPAEARRYGQLKAFKNDAASAFKFGQWFRAINGIGKAQDFCSNNGIPMISDVHSGGSNTAGGYLVPPQFDNQIIELVLEYGAFRRNAQVVNMTSDTAYRPRRTSGLTAYWTAESTAGTESTKGWDQVSLVAKNLRVLTRISNELAEDAIISVADDLAVEIARAFALAEDTAGFSGTGAAATGGIVGVRQRLTDVYANAGLGVLAAAGNWAATTLANMNTVMGALPGFAWTAPKWYCNPAFFHGVMARLAYASGGNSTLDIGGKMAPAFMGYPVEFVNALPATTGAQISCLFGDLAMAAMMGDRRQISIASSDSATIGGESVFERAQLAIRGNQRIDINVHSVGDATTAGPIVGLYNNA